MNGFDKHSKIKYNDLNHLYWGKFSYRVFIPFETPTTKWQKDRGDVENNLRSLISWPAAETLYRSVITSGGFNFYFMDETTASSFIDANHMVAEVWRPHSKKAIGILADAKARIRTVPYWGKYKWCITFGKITIADERELDDWVTDHFEGVEDDRRFYVFANPRKLYLNDELDALAVKVGVGEYVKSIEYAVISSDEQDEPKLHETLERD